MSCARCPTPSSCDADQVCIHYWQLKAAADLAEPRQFHGRERISVYNCIDCGGKITYDGQQPFTSDELRRAARALERYQRHTVDITGPAPHHVEGEALAFERGWRRAKVAWVVLLVVVAGYVVWRLCQ